MAATKNHKAMVKRLKKQLNVSRRKEKSGRKKLKAAIAKVKKTAVTYEKKLAKATAHGYHRATEAATDVYDKLIKLLKGKAKTTKKRKPKKTKTVTKKTTVTRSKKKK